MAWLSGYTYRKKKPANSTTAGAQTNYQMELLVGESSGASGEEIDCESHCQDFPNDIRFTRADEVTKHDYWVESISGTTPNQLATISIEVNSIPASGSVDLYMYYGKSDDSGESNGDNTFEFFDDFTFTTEGKRLIFKSEKHGAGSPNYLNHAEGVSTDGTYVYVTSALDNSLSVFETNTEKTSCTLIYTTGNSAGSPNYLDGAHDSWLEGNFLYVTGFDDNSLTIFNISTPSSPSHVGEIHGAGSPNYLQGACGLWKDGNYIYIAAYHDYALTIIDVSTPASPSFVSSISGMGSPNYLYHAAQVTKSGNLVYVTTTGDNSLTIFDVSTPASPSHVGEIHGAGSPNYLQNSWGLVKSGNYIFVAASFDNRLTVINVSTPSSPSHVISVNSYAGYIDNLALDGDYLYAACINENGISIWNVSDPTNPTYNNGKYGPGAPYYLSASHKLCIYNGYLYQVARDDDSISIFKIEDGVEVIDTGKWTVSGTPFILNSVLTCETSENVKEKATHTYNIALRSKAKFISGIGNIWLGFRDGTSTPLAEFVRIENTDWWARTHVSATEKTELNTNLLGDYHIYEISRMSNECKFWVDGDLKHTSTTQIPTSALPVEILKHTLSGSIQSDWIFLRNYTSPEPTWGTSGSEEGSAFLPYPHSSGLDGGISEFITGGIAR